MRVNGHIETAEQRTVIQQYADCYSTLAVDGYALIIWYSEEGHLRAAASPSPLLAVLNITAPYQWPVYQLHIIRSGTIITFAL